MKVVYKSIMAMMDEAITCAAENNRVIERFELSQREIDLLYYEMFPIERLDLFRSSHKVDKRAAGTYCGIPVYMVED